MVAGVKSFAQAAAIAIPEPENERQSIVTTAIPAAAKPFNLLPWFSLLSLVAIAVTTALSGYFLFLFLSQHLLERDARVSMEFIQSASQINDPGPYFGGSYLPQDRVELEQFFRHITQMPDVLRANVYTRDQAIIWSSDEDLVGKRFNDNDELREALTGRLVYQHEQRGEHGKIEHAYLPNEIDDFLESYVPIWDRTQREVIGVVEIYKAPTALFQALRHGQWLVVLVSAISAVVLYALLFWIVLRGARVIVRQQQALVEAEKLAVIGELTSSVTHNLRNPLAAIRSSAELGLTEINNSARENLEDIVSEVDRLDQWVRELLIIARDDADSGQPASLPQAVESALAHFGQRPQKQGVHIELDLSDELPPLQINAEALVQVLISLIANALEAMPQGKGGRLTLQAARADGEQVVIVQIIDTGHGIAEQYQDDLFQPLVSHKPGGLGIGLPLARRILQRYHASLVLSSRPGTGTTVKIKIPSVTV